MIDFLVSRFLYFINADYFLPSFVCLNQHLKEETAGAMDQLREAESEAKALRTMTQRMVLTHEEMVRLNLYLMGFPRVFLSFLFPCFGICSGRGGFKKVLAFSLLGFSCATW